jgi:hypothetical protein
MRKTYSLRLFSSLLFEYQLHIWTLDIVLTIEIHSPVQVSVTITVKSGYSTLDHFSVGCWARGFGALLPLLSLLTWTRWSQPDRTNIRGAHSSQKEINFQVFPAKRVQPPSVNRGEVSIVHHPHVIRPFLNCRNYLDI